MANTYTGDPRLAPAGAVIGEWPNTGTIIADGNGKFYAIQNGRKVFVPPQVVMQGTDAGMADPSLTKAQNVPGASLFHTAGHFDPETGDFKQNINWNNILAMAVGGGLTAGAASAFMGGGAAAGGGAGAAEATTGVGPLAGGLTGATTTATVPSSLAAVSGGGAAAGGGAGLGTYGQLVGMGLKGAGAASNMMAHNRGTEASLTLDAQQQFEQQLLAREMEKRQARNDALRQSTFASMLAGYQPAPRPAGMPAPAFPQGVGATGNQALTYASQDALKRLLAGDQLPPMQDVRGTAQQYGSSSKWEKLLGILGAAGSFYGGK